MNLKKSYSLIQQSRGFLYKNNYVHVNININVMNK